MSSPGMSPDTTREASAAIPDFGCGYSSTTVLLWLDEAENFMGVSGQPRARGERWGHEQLFSHHRHVKDATSISLLMDPQHRRQHPFPTLPHAAVLGKEAASRQLHGRITLTQSYHNASLARTRHLHLFQSKKSIVSSTGSG
nr:hypothetical protein CFP56_67006 [Quercus suber]